MQCSVYTLHAAVSVVRLCIQFSGYIEYSLPVQCTLYNFARVSEYFYGLQISSHAYRQLCISTIIYIRNELCPYYASSLSLFRHPVPTERPRFSEVSTFLNSTDEVLLNWSNADKAISPRVTEIGAPLSEGVNLYLDLQYIHCVPQDFEGSTGRLSITAV